MFPLWSAVCDQWSEKKCCLWMLNLFSWDVCWCGDLCICSCTTFFLFFFLDSNHEPYIVVLQPAAMFKVLRTDPPIPDNLSPEGKDFLRCCFKRNPTERPTASKLLEHPFIQTSNHYSPQSAPHPFSGIKSPVSFLLPKFQLKALCMCIISLLVSGYCA